MARSTSSSTVPSQHRKVTGVRCRAVQAAGRVNVNGGAPDVLDDLFEFVNVVRDPGGRRGLLFG